MCGRSRARWDGQRPRVVCVGVREVGSANRRGETLVALELSGGEVRIRLVVLVLLTIGVEGAAPQSVGKSACEDKYADPTYCREGKPRPVCLDNGHLVWR